MMSRQLPMFTTERYLRGITQAIKVVQLLMGSIIIYFKIPTDYVKR